MKLAVVGGGYVGLVTAAIFSDFGNDVTVVEISHDRVNELKKNVVPFYEPSLAEFVERNQKQGRLKFTTNYNDAIPNSDVVFICVGTPPKENGEADLSYLFSAIEETAKNLTKDVVFVIKSTFPIGFEDDLEQLARKNSKHNFLFAACPEFLKEGTAIEDSLNPDRVVIGTNDKKAKEILLDLHSPLPGERIICDMRSAQLIKYGSNAFLATKISYINALSIICEKTGADIEKVAQGISADKRIGGSFFKPGIGYGGSCLPKDVLAFIAQASTFDYNFDFLKSVDSINSSQVERFIAKIRKALSAEEGEKPNLDGYNLGILGLAFKPNTDDMRDAPSVKIIKKLQDLKAKLQAYDPKASENAKKVIPSLITCNSIYETAKDKDALIILTDWQEFKEMDLDRIKSELKSPIIVDGRNIFEPQKLKTLGFSYYSIGR